MVAKDEPKQIGDIQTPSTRQLDTRIYGMRRKMCEKQAVQANQGPGDFELEKITHAEFMGNIDAPVCERLF